MRSLAASDTRSPWRVSPCLATALHRHGHAQGDDFALYLRQARSIFDGDIGGVIDDNRFGVLNSDTAFSPIGYPWVWPLVLSPFVHFWGLDYDRLKLVTVAMFCAWLVLLFGIVRRRLGRWPALGVTAVHRHGAEIPAAHGSTAQRVRLLRRDRGGDLVVRPGAPDVRSRPGAADCSSSCSAC